MSKTFKTTVVRDGSACFIPLPFDPKAVFGKGPCAGRRDGERLHVSQHHCGDGRTAVRAADAGWATERPRRSDVAEFGR